jgi:DNA-binding IclR family transcriptional regulator
MTQSELIKALPDHNKSTVSNALQIMLRFNAVKRSGRTWRLQPTIQTEADYRAHLREFRAVRAPVDEDGEPGPYIPVLSSDPLAVALRSRW